MDTNSNINKSGNLTLSSKDKAEARKELQRVINEMIERNKDRIEELLRKNKGLQDKTDKSANN